MSRRSKSPRAACDTGGMASINEGDYLGLAADEAVQRAERDGWVVRVLRDDSVLTMELREDRLNLRVDESNSVIEAKIY